MTEQNINAENINAENINEETVKDETITVEDLRADAAQEEAGEQAKVARDNLREAGDALLAAGSALGAAIGKFAGGLPDRFKSASDTARETLNQATTEGEVRSVATNWANEAEKVFNNFRERDLKFTDEAKETLRRNFSEIRENFNQRIDQTNTEGVEKTVDELRARFDSFVDRLQSQFSAEPKPADEDAAASADSAAEVIEGEIVESDAPYVDTDADIAEGNK